MYKRGVLGDAFTLAAVIIGVAMLLFTMIFIVQVYNFKDNLNNRDYDPISYYIAKESYCNKEISDLLKQEVIGENNKVMEDEFGRKMRYVDLLEKSLKPYVDFLSSKDVAIDQPALTFEFLAFNSANGIVLRDKTDKQRFVSDLRNKLITSSTSPELRNQFSSIIGVGGPGRVGGFNGFADARDYDEVVINKFRQALGDKEYILSLPQGLIVNMKIGDSWLAYNQKKEFMSYSEVMKIFSVLNKENLNKWSIDSSIDIYWKSQDWKSCRFRYQGDSSSPWLEVWLLESK